MIGARRLRGVAAAIAVVVAGGLTCVPSSAVQADPRAGTEDDIHLDSQQTARPTRPIVRPEEGEIWRLYLAVLGRAPEPEGFDYWVARRIERASLRVVAQSFLASREFAARFGATADAEFLDLVYRNVLGRAGDPDGFDYWQGVLASGYPRADLVLQFSESIEHRRVTGTDLSVVPAFDPVVRSPTAGEIGSSWRPGCPVGPDSLRAVDLDHVDSSGRHRRGTLVVNRDVADEIVEIFGALYEARYPLDLMAPVAQFDGDDDASMAAGNTSAFNCRSVTGGAGWSQHAFGRAVDINPIQNPYVAGSTVLPPTGADHLDRSWYDPRMIRAGDVVTAAFHAAGWQWGGRFTSVVDYQHFER